MLHDSKNTGGLESSGARGPNRVLVTLIPILVSCSALVSCSRSSSRAAEQAAIPVLAATVERKNLPLELQAIGTGEAYSSVVIRTQATGELTGVYFQEGQEVRRGDLLFVLDQRAFEAELKKQQGNLARDRAQALLAETQLTRYTALIKEGVVAKEQYDQMQANAEALKASIQADESAVESARVALSYCSIRSPLSGRVGSLLVHPAPPVKWYFEGERRAGL